MKIGLRLDIMDSYYRSFDVEMLVLSELWFMLCISTGFRFLIGCQVVSHQSPNPLSAHLPISNTNQPNILPLCSQNCSVFKSTLVCDCWSGCGPMEFAKLVRLSYPGEICGIDR
jgi:hypothetical protein